MLTQYAESVENTDEKARLLQEIDKIEYIPGTTVCIGIEAQRAFNRAMVQYLIVDLENKTLQLFDPVDLVALKALHRTTDDTDQIID
jgi:hypothetical protein